MKRRYFFYTAGFIIAVLLAVFMRPIGAHTLMFAGAAVVICPIHVYFGSKGRLKPRYYSYWLCYIFVIVFAVLFFFIYRNGRFTFIPVNEAVYTDTTEFTVEEVIPDTVYITPTGKKYHFSASCAGSNAKETSLEEAVNKGLEPCKKCAQK